MNRNITLASNWFGNLFDNVQLRLAGQIIEHINNPAIVMDIFYNMESDEFRKRSGALCGFIPDTSSEISDTIGTRVGNVDNANVPAVLGSLNNANQRNVRTNENYNEGFLRRRRLYNYTIAANDEYREVEIFVSLNRIFSVCDEFNRILKYIPFEIVLTRSGNNTHCVYVANNTAIDFGGNESRLTSTSLQLLRVKLRADIASNLEKLYKRPYEIAYYKRICVNAATQAGTQRTFSHMKTFKESEEGCCRYVFVIINNHANDTNQTNYQRCVMQIYQISLFVMQDLHILY